MWLAARCASGLRIASSCARPHAHAGRAAAGLGPTLLWQPRTNSCAADAVTCGAPWSTRGYASLTRRRRKEMARAAAAETRAVLEFARIFDPMRTVREQVSATLTRLGWPHTRGEAISDGLYVDFALADSYLALEVVPDEAFVDPEHPDASTVPAVDTSGGRGVYIDASGRAALHTSSPFPAAPKLYQNPVLGKVLTKSVAERHALIRSKGWALVAVPAPLWRARAHTHTHAGTRGYAWRDIITSLTLPLAPFEPRPVLATASPSSSAPSGSSATEGKGKAAAKAQTGKGRAKGAAKGKSGTEGASAEPRERKQSAAAAGKARMMRLEAADAAAEAEDAEDEPAALTPPPPQAPASATKPARRAAA